MSCCRILMLLTPLAALVSSGCGVSKDLYRMKESELSKCRTDLEGSQRNVGSLTAENKDLKGQLGALRGEKGDLTGKLEASAKEIAELRRAREVAEKSSRTFRELVARLRAMIDSGKLQVVLRKGRMVVKLGEKILFDPGKTDIKEAGQAALREVAQALKEIPDRDFLVGGHTDNLPIRSRKFDSNWSLSTARALEVVKSLQAEALNPVHLGAAGFSEFDPVADNATADGRAQNRRIEIILMPRIDELPQVSE